MTCQIKGCPAPEATHGKWYLNVNDLIGGECIGTHNGPAHESHEASNVADMLGTRATNLVLVNALDAVHTLAQVDSILTTEDEVEAFREARRVLAAIRGGAK